MDYPKRGSVYKVNFDPTIGAEIKKTRPAVIIQNDVGNRHSPVTIVAPITSGESAAYPVEVEVKAPDGGLTNNSLVLLGQIRAIDKRRLVEKLGKLKPETMRKVDRAIQISLGLVPL
jgi:mRNA interferase MazF